MLLRLWLSQLRRERGERWEGGGGEIVSDGQRKGGRVGGRARKETVEGTA